jgi:acyl-CoA thioesterase
MAFETHLWDNDPAAQRLGVVVDELTDGRAQIRLAVGDDHINGLGVCHGGITFFLADTALAYAASGDGDLHASTSANITYTAPVRRGDTLTAVAERVNTTGRSSVYDVRVTDQHNTTVAMFRGQATRIDPSRFA